ncbi:MAG: mechanosensitive ion channel family protein [Acidimicrobiales bacterium]
MTRVAPLFAQSSEVCENGGEICDQLYSWTDSESFAEIASFVIGVPVKTVIIVATALILNHFGRRWAAGVSEKLGEATEDHQGLVSDRNAERAEERAETIGSMLKSLVSFLVFSLAAIVIMELIGIEIAAAITSAGVLAIAVGFGAQSIVADLFAGVFMLSEDQFSVGDRVDAGPVNGYVQRMTLRTTVIRDANGKIWHVPNSQIEYVANETQSWSRAVVIMGVSYDADIRRAVDVLEAAARDVSRSEAWREGVVEEPTVQAVQELGDESVNLRVLVRVEAARRREMERALRLHCKVALDEAGIEIPNPGLDVFVKEGGLTQP